jgi:hypothetical protein
MQDGSVQKAVGPVAIGAIVLAAAFAVLGTFGEPGGNNRARDFLIVLAVVAVGAVVVFGFVVPRWLGREAAGAGALARS